MSPRKLSAHELFSARGVELAKNDPSYEQTFFRRVRLSNGTFKTTCARRLDDLNQAIRSLLSIERPLQLLDVAMSSGISTAEWSESLEAEGVEFTLVGTDLCIDASIVDLGPLHILCDKAGHAMLFESMGISFQNALGEHLAEKGIRAIPISAARIAFQIALAASPSLRESIRNHEAFGRFGIRQQPVELVSYRLRQNPRIQLVEDNIFEDSNPDWRGRFDVVRAANILHHSYFSDDELRQALRVLAARLAPGGLLAICRTDKQDRNDATIFQRQEDGRLAVVSRLGDGTKIEHLVIGLEPVEIRSNAPQPT